MVAIAIGMLAWNCGGSKASPDGGDTTSAHDGDDSKLSGDASLSTYYDCTIKDSSGTPINIGKPCASMCWSEPSGNGFDWLYAGSDGTCEEAAFAGYCAYATMMTCGSTQGSTCTGGGDSGVVAHCGS